MRNCMRSPAGRCAFSAAIASCTASAHSTASTALAKSASTLSPAVVKIRPRYSAISRSRIAREVRNARNVPISSCSISWL